jgi:hypothetical protein
MPGEEFKAKHPPGSPGGLLITKLLVAGAAHTQINKALEKEGLATISKQAVFVRRQTPEVQAGIKAAIDDAVQSGALTKRRRLRAYDDRFEMLGSLLESVAKEAAKDIKRVPGVAQLLREQRETMKQAAIERGEWTTTPAPQAEDLDPDGEQKIPTIRVVYVHDQTSTAPLSADAD